jgi:hypothetical protein
MVLCKENPQLHDATREGALRLDRLPNSDEAALGRGLINRDGQVGGCSMSAIPPKADVCSALTHVRYGP